MSKNETLDDKDILLKLSKDFHDLVTNKEELRASVEHFLDNTIDEITLGIIFDLHRKYKTSDYEIEEEDEDEDGEEEDNEEIDVFAQQDLKKTQKCVCSICDRAVAAIRFAQHLEACMGMRRNRFRNATRSVVSNNNKDRENSSFSSVPSDDEDDIDWNSGNKRGKKKKRSNGNNNKKPKGTTSSGGTPKKNVASNKPNEAPTTIEIEPDEDELLREMLQDHSNSSSPADSVSSTHSNSSKKKDKTKSKKNKRDRTSPNSSISAE